MMDLRVIELSESESLEELWIKAGAVEVREFLADRIAASAFQGPIIAGWFMTKIDNKWIPAKVWIEDKCDNEEFEEYRSLESPRRRREGLFCWHEAADGEIAVDRAIVKWTVKRAMQQIEYAAKVPNSEPDQRYAEEWRKLLESMN